MKNIAIIIVCLLVSVWAISTFFDSPKDAAIVEIAETDTGVDKTLIGQVPLAVKASNPTRPGQAVRLELPSEQKGVAGNSETASRVSTPAVGQTARAIRVVPRQKKEGGSLGPIPEPAMQVKAEFVVQEGHAQYIEDIAFGSNGKYLASSGYNKRVKLWDLKTGQLIRTLHHNLSYEHGPIVEFSQDGKMLYTGGGMPFKVRSWDLAGNKLIRQTSLRSVADFQRGLNKKLMAG